MSSLRILPIVCKSFSGGTLEDSAELKPVDRYQVLDPAKFRISGHDGGVHAYRDGYRESVCVSNGEASLEAGSFKNISEGVWHGLYGEGLEAVKKILSQLKGPLFGCYVKTSPMLISFMRRGSLERSASRRRDLTFFEPAFFV